MTEVINGDAPSEEALERGRRLFAGACEFIFAAAPGAALPPPGPPEVAFAGRSNVGKSSLLNALTGRRTLARTSNTPGRTQQINFFDLGGRIVLVDLPGYGYARASKNDIAAWNRAFRDYLAGRPNLARLFLLIDARHGLKASDRDMMAELDPLAVTYQLVLTKCDKIAAAAAAGRSADLGREIARHAAAFPQVLATSAHDRTGIDVLRATIAALADDRASR